MLGREDEHAANQFTYNEETNIHAGIVEPELSADHAIRSALASGWNRWNGWDVDAARQAASEILEDANDHESNRLMQAAPEMLAALGKAVTWIETFKRIHNLKDDGPITSDITEIKNAIAKAKGA